MKSNNFGRRKEDRKGYVYCPEDYLEDIWVTFGMVEYLLHGKERKLKDVPCFNTQRKFFEDGGYSVLRAARKFYNGRCYAKLLCKGIGKPKS